MKKILSLLLLIASIPAFAGPPVVLNPAAAGLYRQTPWLSDWSSGWLTNVSTFTAFETFLNDNNSLAALNGVISNNLSTNYATLTQLAAATNGLTPTNSNYALTAGSFTGYHSGNGAGLTNLNFYATPSNAVNFLAGNGIVTQPEVRDATAFWNSWNGYGAQWLVEAAAFRPGWQTATGLTTLRGNRLTWANPVYSWSGDGAAINTTSTVAIYLPATITNYIVVESWRTDYKSGWTPAGTLYKLVDTNSGSEALLHANTGTSLPNFAYYEAAATGSSTNYSCTSSINWWPPNGTNGNYWLPTYIAAHSSASGNMLKETPARAPQRKVTAMARTAAGYVTAWQDCTFGWFTTNTANFTASIGAVSNQCQAFYQITNSPGLAPQFNELVIGPDSVYSRLLITNDSTGSMGVGTTNFILESVQVLTFTNSSQVPGLVAESVICTNTGASLDGFRREHVGHTIPLSERFGGWHVTGAQEHGDHLGNLMGEAAPGGYKRLPDPPGAQRPRRLCSSSGPSARC